MTRSPHTFWSTAAALLCLAAGTPALAQFETRASISTGAFVDVAVSLVTGDFDRDGKLDVAVIEYHGGSGNVAIFLGNGDGTFRTGTTYAVAVQPFYAAAASFRNNGILDLVVGDSGSDNVYVMLGNGDGTFQPAVAYPTSGRPTAVSTGNFTADGRIDIIALTGPGAQCNCVEVLPSNGDGTFGSLVSTPVPYNVDGFEMAVGDFDGDGKLDVAVTGGFGSANQVDILLGNGDGSFRADGYYPVSSSPYSIASGHFNADSKIDLAVGNYQGNSISVLLGNGDGTFGQAVDYDTYSPTWVAVGDLNGDGKEDLVASNLGSFAIPSTASVSVLMGNGDGTFQPGVVYPAGGNLKYVAIGDFNGDHEPDLVVVDELGGAIITLLNTGVVAFSPTTPLTFASQLLGTKSAPKTVILTNTGTTALSISSISLQGGGQFQSSHTCGTSVAPGANCSITVRSQPTIEGSNSGTITIHDSASSKPQVIELLGAGTVVKLAPLKLTFPAQKVGTKSAPQNVTLTNQGSTTLSITKIDIYGYNYKDFSETNTCPSSLNVGASCTIRVTFDPLQPGARHTTLYAYDTGGGSSQTVPLTGTGD
jgi:archaellum component FlaF (FlaF/FlaG flagellin family)